MDYLTVLERTTLLEEIKNLVPIDRYQSFMFYRGRPITRSKLFFVDSLENVPIYLYPGFTYRSVLEYKSFDMAPWLNPLRLAIERQFKVTINHVIGTWYYDGFDNIGWHDDKTKTMNRRTPVFICSFGYQRPLHFRLKGEKEKTSFSVPMQLESLFVMSLETNAKYQHAILPTKDDVGLRISFVFRNINNRKTRRFIYGKIAAYEAKKKAKEEVEKKFENDEFIKAYIYRKSM
jgi:alkylated DNA repair dioxygenase AlkB